MPLREERADRNDCRSAWRRHSGVLIGNAEAMALIASTGFEAFISPQLPV